MNNELKQEIMDIPWVTESEIYHRSQEAFVRVLKGESWDEALLDLVSQWEQEAIEMGEKI